MTDEPDWEDPPEREKDLEIYEEGFVFHVGPWHTVKMAWGEIEKITLSKIHAVAFIVAHLAFETADGKIEVSNRTKGYNDLIDALPKFLNITHPEWPRILRRSPVGAKTVIYHRDAQPES